MNVAALPEPGTTASAERPIVFACAGAQLVGICSPAPADLGVVVVVGGPQYRGGSHRQFVLLARQLAAAGFPVLRFDVRGMGDSEGEQRGFESITPDIAAAIDTLCAQQPQVRRVVLWGLCDGASAALLYLQERQDARICGVALANPWVRSPVSQARAQVKHYYTRRLREPAFWRKLVSGAVSPRALGELFGALNRMGRTLEDSPIDPARAAGLLKLVEEGVISGSMAKQVFEAMLETGESASAIVEARGLRQTSDTSAIDAAIVTILDANADKVVQYRSGKEALFGFFVGQTMKAMNGKANPGVVNARLKAMLMALLPQ